MRRVAWLLLLTFAFAIPWEYSLDLGAPLGNVARFTGLLLLLAAVPAVLQTGNLRRHSVFQWLVLALYLWFCCSFFWTIDQVATLAKLRGFFQEMMIVWLVWEFADTPRDLRWLLRAFLAGSWVLALLTLADFRSADAFAAEQFRFAAYGQDPNDVARFLDLGFPAAALLANSGGNRLERVLAFGYIPLGLVSVILTASRGGFMAAAVALIGCTILLARGHARAVLTGAFALPAMVAALWLCIPADTFARLASIPEELSAGNLNQRLNIWSAGWSAFVHAPLFGSGAGTFVSAARLSPIDTAHNTALSLAVGGGLIALSLGLAIFLCAVRLAFQTHGPLRLALTGSLAVWAVASLVGTVEENRTTWLLFGIVALAARLSQEDPELLSESFPEPGHESAAIITSTSAARPT